jgi:hypothetical protein
MLIILSTIADHPKNAPSIFIDNPELSNGFHNFAEDYHSTLNTESTREYLINVGVVIQDNIGPYQDGTGNIEANQTQKCIFTESDEGPINLTPTQRIDRKYDKLV